MLSVVIPEASVSSSIIAIIIFTFLFFIAGGLSMMKFPCSSNSANLSIVSIVFILVNILISNMLIKMQTDYFRALSSPAMKKILIVLFIIPLFAASQNTIEDSLFIHKIAVNILSGDAAYNNLHYLTKNIGGRLSGSPHMYLAEQWGAQAMKDAGADNVTMQECMVPHWIRGGTDNAIIIYKDKNANQQKYSLHILALGNSVGTGA